MKKSLMTKLGCLLLVMIMAVSLAACGSKGIAGNYELESVETGGMTLKIDEFLDLLGSDVEFEVTLKINEDGTFKMSSNMMGEKEEVEGTWEQNGDTLNMTADGSSIPATYKDGKITMESDGMGLVFSK